MDLETFLAATFPSWSPQRLLGVPLADADPTVRALVGVAVTASRPQTPPSAIHRHVTWEDLRTWLWDVEGPSPVARPARWVYLRPLLPADTTSLYLAGLGPDHGRRWRFRGRTVSFEEYAQTLHEGVLCQFAVCAREGDALQGVVAAYNADLSSGHAHFAFVRCHNPSARVPGALTDGAALFLDHLFRSFPLRVVYFELAEHNLPLVRVLAELNFLEEVAHYPQHLYFEGDYQDCYVFRLTRATWLEHARAWTAL
jgi:RimJ/RimL family protein N-acetyltransferase